MVSIYFPARYTEENVIAHYSKCESITKKSSLKSNKNEKTKYEEQNIPSTVKSRCSKITQHRTAILSQLSSQISVSQTVIHPSQNKEKGRVGQHKEDNHTTEHWIHSIDMNFFNDKGTIAKHNKVLQKVEIKHQEESL